MVNVFTNGDWKLGYKWRYVLPVNGELSVSKTPGKFTLSQ